MIVVGRGATLALGGVHVDVLAAAADGTIGRVVRRRCRVCKRTRRTHVDFHRDPKGPAGIATRCRACSSRQTAAWAAANRARKNRTDRDWKRRNRHKDRARGAVRTALRRGELVKPDACGCCGDRRSADGLEAHHVDYRRPLDVRWLCKRCHATHHDWGRKKAS